MKKFEETFSDVKQYFVGKVAEHGVTAKGLDWKNEAAQQIFLEPVTRILPQSGAFSVLDYGCGFGVLYDALTEQKRDFTYTGYDVAEVTVDAAKAQHASAANAVWTSDGAVLTPADYLISSGIFNVRLQHTDEEWKAFILETLHSFDRLAVKGFAFNMLTSYSDKEFMKDYLYYSEPMFFFDYCKRHFSKYVALLHDYPAFAFTILVRKDVQA